MPVGRWGRTLSGEAAGRTWGDLLSGQAPILGCRTGQALWPSSNVGRIVELTCQFPVAGCGMWKGRDKWDTSEEMGGVCIEESTEISLFRPLSCCFSPIGTLMLHTYFRTTSPCHEPVPVVGNSGQLNNRNTHYYNTETIPTSVGS